MQLNQKTIAFVHEIFPFGGAERVTIDVANYLSMFNYKVYVFAGKYLKDKLPANIPVLFTVIELPEEKVRKSEKDAQYMIHSIKQYKIKTLVAVVQGLNNYMGLIVKETDCNYVFSHHSTPFWEIQFKLDNARKRKKESFLKRLEWYFISYPKYTWIKKHEKRFQRIYKETYSLADSYIVLCDEYKSTIIESLHIDPQDNKIRVIPNSERKVESPNLVKNKQLLFVGRLSYSDKRVDRLIDIWERIEKRVLDWELIIVGDGEEKTNLENESRQRNLKRIRFVGAVNNVQPYYHDAAVLCLVSTLESWGLCLTEAQANGVVPIAFDCSAGVHSILSPSGINGILIPPFNLNKYTEALIELLQKPELLDTLRQNVLKKSEEYSIEVIGRKWMKLIEELS